MQERKSKMNAAIMESNASSDKKERREMIQNAMNRFLTSPAGKNTASKGKKEVKNNGNKEKENDVISLV